MRNFFTDLKNIILSVLATRTAQASADEATARKERSIQTLRAEGVHYIDHLPEIETENECLRRSRKEVIERTIALAIIAIKGQTADDALAHRLISQFGANEYFTPAEQAFIDDPTPSENDRNQFSWRFEAVHMLLWALGIHDQIGRPEAPTDVSFLSETLRKLGPEGLRKKARLRPQAEILNAADLIYRYHWAVVDARVNGGPIPPTLHPGVVYERHYTLNWLIGYADQSWDEISTDT